MPVVSSVNYQKGYEIQASFYMAVNGGLFNVYAQTPVTAVIDVTGYFANSKAGMWFTR
jgi:hypothetical protein